MMFLQTFLTAYAITLGILSAAATLVLAAAFFVWIVGNIRERKEPPQQQMPQKDDWPYDGPIGG